LLHPPEEFQKFLLCKAAPAIAHGLATYNIAFRGFEISLSHKFSNCSSRKGFTNQARLKIAPGIMAMPRYCSSLSGATAWKVAGPDGHIYPWLIG
jgi:hypothetical protein